MDGQGQANHIVISVLAYYGQAREVNGIPTLDKVEHSQALSREDVVNDPYLPCQVGESLDELLERFQAEHGCKVSYLDDDVDAAPRVFELFEPTWPDRQAADAAACELANRLTAYTCGR